MANIVTFSQTLNVSAKAGKSGKVSAQSGRMAENLSGQSVRSLVSVALAGGTAGKMAGEALRNSGAVATLDGVGATLDGGSLPLFLALMCAHVGGKLPPAQGSKLAQVQAFINVARSQIEIDATLEGGVYTKTQAAKMGTLAVCADYVAEYVARRDAAILAALVQDTAQGDTAQGDTAQGDTAQGDTAQGDTAQGDTAQGDTAQGDTAQGDTAQGAE